MSTTRLSLAIEALRGLLDPWLFLALAASFLPGTVTHIFQTQDLPSAARTLASPARFRDVWFSQFWGFVGPTTRDGAAPRVLPLLDGRTTRGRVVETPVGPGVGGVVIEIGAGSGLWVDVFAKRHLFEDASGGAAGDGVKRANTARSEITRVFGVEPNAAHHAALRRAVETAGLQGVYEIVPVGIEDLSSGFGEWDGRIEPGSVDCIVSVLCLCSIPDPERHTRELYRLLRPGGRWYIYEHVRCEYSWYMRLYQSIVNLVWPYFLNGCVLDRQTEKTLREAGPWTSVDIGQPPIEPWYHSVPHILGVLTK